MKLVHYLDRYLVDKDYSITIRNHSVYIVNYLEVEDFSNTRIVIKYNKGKTVLIGNDLVVSKMMRDELLILGNVTSIEV